MTRQRTRNQQTLPDPRRFGLESFAAILPQHQAIVGEDAGSYEAFHASLRQSLNPGTPYEAVIAENLIAIEWELLQHRRMRDAVLRRSIRRAIRNAVTDAGGEQAAGEDLAERAVSGDRDVQTAAYDEIKRLGMDPVELMGEAFRGTLARRAESPGSGFSLDPFLSGVTPAPDTFQADTSADYHDAKIRELERRRREVKRDFDQLQQSRPHEAGIIEQ